jgi:hypothetical protein
MLHVSVAEVSTAEVSGHSLEIPIAKVRRHKLLCDGGDGLELLISECERRHKISSRPTPSSIRKGYISAFALNFRRSRHSATL